ncbi:MAG: hypothetical protein J6P89_02210, partial [Oscillospiraceae bacterium]|nr:hypothetical protein [Oscillospiraceae bacterium]
EIPSGDFERTFNLKEDGTATNGACNMLTIKSTNWDGPAIKGITITSVDIYFTERGAVVPTAAPVVTPTPEPTPTAEPTEEPTTAPNFTATTSMEAGEKYLILFNDTAVNQSTNLYYENVGILYALTNTTSATAMTFDSEITDDRSGITVDLDSVLNAVWSCEAYEGSTTQFTLKNVGSGKYLRNNNGTLDFADSIAQNCAWTYTARTGEGYSYNCLLSVTDNTKFVRISNGSAVFKFGSTTSSTDGRNANAYLYKYRSDLFSVPTDPSDEGWVPGWY